MLVRARTAGRLSKGAPATLSKPIRPSYSKAGSDQQEGLGQFKKVKETYYAEFDTKLLHFSHSTFGTDYFHFANSSPSNVFSILLRVRPVDGKGYPFILERMIQCGTRSHPVRDLMNIACERIERKNFDCLTTSNFIYLPVASRDKAALEILRGLLGETVFGARLEQLDFLDQAFRYEMHNQQFKQKGYVYERVLSNYGLQSFCFAEQVNKLLFRDSHFANSMCGVPSQIAQTSFEELRSFVKKQLVPSRLAFMSYGDFDVERHMAFIENQCLLNLRQNSESSAELDRAELKKVVLLSSAPDNSLDFGKRTDSPLAYRSSGGADLTAGADEVNSSPIGKDLKNELQMQYFMQNNIRVIEGPLPDYFARPKQGAQFSITLLCPESLKDPLDYFGLNILSILLSEGTESILFKNFIETNKATGLCAGFGFDGSSVVPSFTFGLKGVAESQAELEQRNTELKSQIREISKHGFDWHTVDRLLTLVEINAKTPRPEFGEQILQDFAPYVNFNRPHLFEGQLSLSKTLKLFRHKATHESFLQQLVSKYVVQNTQRLEVALVPSSDYYKNLTLAQNRLASDAFIASNSEEKGLIEHTRYELKEYKQMLQDLSVIPGVPISELREQFEFTQHAKKTIENVAVTFIPQPTNGIVFLKLRFDVSDFTEEDLRAMAMVEKSLGRTANKNFRKIDFHEYVSSVFGEWRCWSACYQSFDDKMTPKQIFCIETFVLEQNLEASFNLISQLLCDSGFDNIAGISQILKLEGLNSTDLLIVNALENCMDAAEEGFLPALRFNSEFQKVSLAE